MTSTADRSTTVERTEPAGRLRRRSGSAAGGDAGQTLTVGEVICLLGVTVVASVASASLALAQLGRHEGWLALVLGLATAAAVVAVARVVGGRCPVKVDVVELVLLAAVVVAGLFFFLPGFHYAWVDKDPGVYVAHGFAIAREGTAYIADPLLERGIEPTQGTGGRFPGFWIEGDHPTSITVQFYHLFSALLATASDLGGARALFNLNPVMAVGSVCVLVVAARRAAGTVVAAIAGALLVTSMMQVWQAKYPSTEILAQLLLGGALLATVLAIERRWSGGAFLAGVLLGVGFLARPDGFLYIGLAAVGIGLVVAFDRVDRRLWALLGGLTLTLPYALWNAYEARGTYTRGNGVPGPLILIGSCVLVVAAGYAARRLLARLARRHPDALAWRPAEAIRRWRVPIGTTVWVLLGATLVVYLFREQLFGLDYKYYRINDSFGRTFDELNLRWLSWFVTMRGLAVMWLGMGVLLVGGLARKSVALMVLVTPGMILMFLYLWDPQVAMRLMWWVRRFIPAVLPAVVLLIAVALAFAITRRSVLVKLGGAVLALSLVVEWAGMSLPLRDHDEMAGSWDMAAAIAATAGEEEALFLFPPGQSILGIQRNAPGAVWFVFDQDAARLPADYDVTSVEDYQDAFPERPVFLVTSGSSLPDHLPEDRFSRAREVAGELVLWEETQAHRPAEQQVLPMGASVWRFDDPEPAPASR